MAEWAWRNYYYCYEDGEKRQFIAENGLNKLEDVSLPVLEQLRTGKFDLSDVDRMTFAGYIALSHLRVPTAHQRINHIEALVQAQMLEAIAHHPPALKEVVQRIEEEEGKKIDLEDFRQKLVGGAVKVTQTDRGWVLRRMFQMLVPLQEAIYHMHWTFLTCENSDLGFLTTDNPVCLYDPTPRAGFDIGFASSSQAHFLFPICRTVCLLGSHQKVQRLIRTSSAKVRATNSMNVGCADTQLYAPFRSDGVQKLLNHHVATKPPHETVLFRHGRAVEE
jgi:hypothetical protein